MIHTSGLTSITATGLAKSFGTGGKARAILDGLDIALPQGALSLIKGPSGCGKSTLLAILAGLTPPDRGEVNLLGTRIWSLGQKQRDAFRLAELGFIFQGSILFPALTASQQIELVLGYMGIGPAEATRRAQAALEAVGLAGRAALRPDALSGGEKQRVAIACALAKSPRIIFADEPTSALDGENSDLVSDQLRRLARAEGASVVCVTHDDRLTRFADHILTMREGRIVGPYEGPSL
ncbi:MAG: ABC transporter ATP-binding protein [Paracoccus sp. (in: a-proteobacteria)]|nr:ABC transporter ATP-binding protein [Paracoccus sp. (in: a-proteobacteria)]